MNQSLICARHIVIRDLPRFIDFMGEHELTPSQFFLCYILFLDKQQHDGALPHEGPVIANVYRWAEKVGPWPDEGIHDLVEKGFLKNARTGRNIYPDHLEVTNAFVEAAMASRDEFRSLWAKYPQYGTNADGKRVPLKACGRREARRVFYRHCRSRETLREMRQALRYAKSKALIDVPFDRWIDGDYWKEHLRAARFARRRKIIEQRNARQARYRSDQEASADAT